MTVRWRKHLNWHHCFLFSNGNVGCYLQDCSLGFGGFSPTGKAEHRNKVQLIFIIPVIWINSRSHALEKSKHLSFCLHWIINFSIPERVGGCKMCVCILGGLMLHHRLSTFKSNACVSFVWLFPLMTSIG